MEKESILYTEYSRVWLQKNHSIYQNNKQTSFEKKEVEPVQPVQMNIYQSNTYTKDLSCQHFDDETAKDSGEAGSEGQTVLHIHFCSLSNNSK